MQLTSLMQTVRRLALSALNSAARTKPHLIREHLPTLLPTLYAETKVNPELIRTVQMGPWTHKVDDGLDARKTAWETLYTLVSQRRHSLRIGGLSVSRTAGHMPPQTRPSDVPHIPPSCAQRSVGRNQSVVASAHLPSFCPDVVHPASYRPPGRAHACTGNDHAGRACHQRHR